MGKTPEDSYKISCGGGKKSTEIRNKAPIKALDLIREGVADLAS